MPSESSTALLDGTISSLLAVQPYEPSVEFLIGNQPYKGQRILPTP